MSQKVITMLFAVCFLACAGTVNAQLPGGLPNPPANNPSPELVGDLTKHLSITPGPGHRWLWGHLRPGEIEAEAGRLPENIEYCPGHG